MKGKVGLITIYHVPNFGSVLQTYATQEVLRKLGYECVVLQYQYPNEWHYAQGRVRPSLKSRIGRLLGLKPTHRKANKLEKFRRKFFNFSRPYSDLDAMKTEDWNEYHAVVVGSDQVWKPQFTLGDSAFLLSFLPDDKYRISIASSFASKSVPEQFRDKYKEYLSKFNAISVREQNGIDIINNELKINCNPTIVLDPTLLLSREEWLKAIPRSTFKKKKKYILFYMLAYAFEPRPYIFEVLKYLQTQDDYEILALEGYTTPDKACGVEMIDKRDSSIPEFIDLFANADVVVTSSFHGTAFAVNFGIPLISVVPNGNSDDRQSSFLKNVGLENCIATVDIPIGDIRYNYNTVAIQNKLQALRDNSIDWIKNHI